MLQNLLTKHLFFRYNERMFYWLSDTHLCQEAAMRSEQIKQWLKDNDLSHQKVAERIGYARVSVTRALGREQVSEEFWWRFCAAFPEAAVALAGETEEQALDEKR